MTNEPPIVEFDDDPTSMIEPLSEKKLPVHCVIVFYDFLIKKLRRENALHEVYRIKSPLPPIRIYKLRHASSYLAVVCPTGCGAPLAGGLLEELIGLGCRKFVACGCAGVLRSKYQRGFIFIPDSAIRDEGTSYHYLSPSRIVEADPSVVQKLAKILEANGVAYKIGRTWTTDAFYRETRRKIDTRRKEGCLTVEMECSALFAVAKFRNVLFGQYLLAGDDCGGIEWNPRREGDLLSVPEKIFWLSVEACLTL